MDRIEKLKEFLAKDPGDAFLKHALAMEYVAKGDDPAARLLWEEILEKDPAYIGSYMQLSRLFERIGEKDLAIEWYRKGMEAARSVKDMRSFNELRAALEDLED
jgi:Tfp pilus assembly protein PilF